MEDRILVSTKKLLGIAEDYTVFDVDVITHINTAFSTLTQLGVGPDKGFMITDDSAVWADYGIEDDLVQNQVKTYIYLRCQQYFDPPTTRYTIASIDNQITKFEWMLNVNREATKWTYPDAGDRVGPISPVVPVPPPSGPAITSIDPTSAALDFPDLQFVTLGAGFLALAPTDGNGFIARITCIANAATFEGLFQPFSDTQGNAFFTGVQSGAMAGPAKLGVYTPDGTTLMTNEMSFEWTTP